MKTYKNIMGNEFTLEQIQEQFNQFAKKFLEENLFFDYVMKSTVGFGDRFCIYGVKYSDSDENIEYLIETNSTSAPRNLYNNDTLFSHLDVQTITRDEAQYL